MCKCECFPMSFILMKACRCICNTFAEVTSRKYFFFSFFYEDSPPPASAYKIKFCGKSDIPYPQSEHELVPSLVSSLEKWSRKRLKVFSITEEIYY